MTKTEKTTLIEGLKKQFIDNKYFYITDCSALPVKRINKLRRQCFEQGVVMQVAKNKLIQKALQWAEEETNVKYSELFGSLKGSSTVMFAEVGNLPAKLIKEFRADAKKPAIKAAFIDTAVFLGDDSLEALTKIKSKAELLGDVIGMLQSPMQNLIGALNSGGNTIAGLLKTLEERESESEN
jgi:large subunit ribosomal protein L10